MSSVSVPGGRPVSRGIVYICLYALWVSMARLHQGYGAAGAAFARGFGEAGPPPPRLRGGRLRFGGGKSQAHVVGDPRALAVAELRFQSGANLLQVPLAGITRQRVQEALRERLEPADDIAGQWRRTRDQRDRVDAKSCPLEARGVIAGCREVPRPVRRAIESPAIERLHESR